MPKLVAHFDIEMPGQCLIAWPEGERACFSVGIGSFDITIRLIPDESWGSKGINDTCFTRGVAGAEICVVRMEDEFPPEVVRNENGQMDYTIQSDYFASRSNVYGEVAREAANRMIRFFRYSLNTPLLRELSPGHQSLRNAEWTDEDGKAVGKAGGVFVMNPVHGLHGELDVRKLAPDNSSLLSLFLNEPPDASLTDEILSDAQSAWFEGNLRRAVLELAIACEVIVKRHFFAGDSPAGAAFDYLEDKAKVSVRIPELIDRVCTEAFARSFRDDHPDRYRDVDHLFRCRNKVAHRGELSFRDDGGRKIDVDALTVQSWWNAVVALRTWLRDISSSPYSGIKE